MMKTKILAVGTSVPEQSYTQAEMIRIMGVTESKALRFFKHEHIHARNLIFPAGAKSQGKIQEETPAELREKFINNSVRLIKKAMDVALEKASLNKKDIHYIACVTSTGFLVPGLSALIIENLGFNEDCQRVDIVGMGCNAGLNGLNTVTAWCERNPEKNALLICCELCSCLYTIDEEENTSLVNSLFGDGIAVGVLKTSDTPAAHLPSVLGFRSHLIPDSLHCLRFNFIADKNRYSFYVDKKTPSILAEFIERPLQKILATESLTISDIKHWIMHTGGDAILKGIQKRLDLPEVALKHTRSVLRDHGNVSSGSFLFSYDRLLNAKEVMPGDYGLMVTMGPGLTIEMALLRWPS